MNFYIVISNSIVCYLRFLMQFIYRNKIKSAFFLGCLISLSVALYLKNSNVQSTAGYWVWKPSDLKQLQNTDEIIIYQGNIIHTNGKFSFRKKGIDIQRLQGRKVTLLVRVYQLPPVEFFTSQINYLINEWQQKGVSIKGIQIDYDSPSSKLNEYGAFLHSLNGTYGRNFVSITGLSSWLTDNIKGVNDLKPYIDYVAIQFYQAFLPVYKTEHYIKRLKGLKIDYKVGVTTSAKFDRYTFDETPHYVGKLVFLNGNQLNKKQEATNN